MRLSPRCLPSALALVIFALAAAASAQDLELTAPADPAAPAAEVAPETDDAPIAGPPPAGAGMEAAPAPPEATEPAEAPAAEPAPAEEPTSTPAPDAPAPDAPAPDAPATEPEPPAADAAKTLPDPADSSPAVPAAPPAPAVKPLTPEQAALAERIRRVTAAFQQQAFNTRDCTPGQVLDICLGLGHTVDLHENGPAGRKINALGVLCWNHPCAGQQLLAADGRRPLARLGYGLQQYPSQFLAVAAQSRLAADYEIRVGSQRGTIGDLIEYEKASCRPGANSPLKLVGLAYYVRNNEAWENDRGEKWSMQRLVEEELARSVSPAGPESVHHLLALSYAVARQATLDMPAEPSYDRAREYVAQYQAYALRMQNADGSWNASFFAYQGPNQNAMAGLRASGHILEWLAFSLPEAQLEDARVVKAVNHVATTLASQTARPAAALAPRDLESVMHAAHALRLYDTRCLAPRTPPSPPTAGPAATTAQRTAGAR